MMRRSELVAVIGFLGFSTWTVLGSVPPTKSKTPLSSIKKWFTPKPKLPSFKNWGLINTKGKSHINAVEAWKLQEGNKNVIVAVIDTGVDPSHKALSSNIWRDEKDKEKPFGWNFVANKANPFDDHGHGTHVAGIIGAVADPSSGVSGVAHKVSLMSVKYYSESNPGSVNLRNTVKAINYAVDHGAKIINYSGGGPEFSEEEYNALKKAEARGILVIAAAGNERENTDVPANYYYPSAYRLPNTISVAATDIHNNLLPSSNWGKTKVDLAAPGENIFSTLPGGKYGYMSGTSQATAFVTGVAVLLLAQDPTLKPAQIREIILSSVDPFPQLESKLATGGRVNAYNALLALRNREKPNSKPGKPGLLAQKPTSLMNLLSSPDAEAQAP